MIFTILNSNACSYNNIQQATQSQGDPPKPKFIGGDPLILCTKYDKDHQQPNKDNGIEKGIRHRKGTVNQIMNRETQNQRYIKWVVLGQKSFF